MLLLPIFFTMGACSSDDSEDNNEGNDPLSHLSEDAKKLVGCWDEGWVFYPDGTCCFIDHNGYEISREYGEWTYDDKTKLLTTTVGSKQYSVSLLSQNSWAGINLGSGSTVSWHRYDIGYAGELISRKQWSGNSNIRISPNTHYTSGTGVYMHELIWGLNGWEKDTAFPKIKDPSEFYEDGEYRSYGGTYYTVQVERCIEVSKASFVTNTSMLLEATIGDDYFWTDEWYGYKTNLSRQTFFTGTILLENMYSDDAKLTIDGNMNGQSFKREYRAIK